MHRAVPIVIAIAVMAVSLSTSNGHQVHIHASLAAVRVTHSHSAPRIVLLAKVRVIGDGDGDSDDARPRTDCDGDFDHSRCYSAIRVQFAGHVSGGPYFSYAALEALWRSAGGASWAAPTAACIAEHESSGYQYATGAIGERGLWQISPIHGALSTYSAFGNARAAVIISGNGASWSAWTTASMCGV